MRSKMTLSEYTELASREVVKANELVTRTKFTLTATQQKIILYLISLIKPDDDMLMERTISVADFCRACGIEYGGATYDLIWEQLDRLRKAEITYNGSTRIPLENGKETSLSWILKGSMTPRTGEMSVILDPDLVPFLLHLREQFLHYELLWVLAFKSKFSIRLYEYCLARHYNRLEPYSFTIGLDELRERMGATAQSYAKFRNFRQRCLVPAVEEINETSDITIDAQPIMEKNRVKALRISIATKPIDEQLAQRVKLEKRIYPDQEEPDPNQISFDDLARGAEL